MCVKTDTRVCFSLLTTLDLHICTVSFLSHSLALRHCAQDCLDPDECVVLTGHSQGGAVSTMDFVLLSWSYFRYIHIHGSFQ